MKKMMLMVVMLIVAMVASAQVITSMGMENGRRVIYLSNGQKIDAYSIPGSNRFRIGETINMGQYRVAAEDYAREAAKYQVPMPYGYGYGTAGVHIGTKNAGFSINLPVGGYAYPGAGANVEARVGSFHIGGNVPVVLVKKNKKDSANAKANVAPAQVQQLKTTTNTTTVESGNTSNDSVKEIRLEDLMKIKR